MKPYLHKLPAELDNFSTLFTRLGVQNTFSKQDYAAAVDTIRLKYGESPLPDREFDIAVSLIKQLEEADLGGKTIHLPTTRKTLMPANDCYFNDAEWISSDNLRNDIFLVATEIPNSLAQFLGKIYNVKRC